MAITITKGMVMGIATGIIMAMDMAITPFRPVDRMAGPS